MRSLSLRPILIPRVVAIASICLSVGACSLLRPPPPPGQRLAARPPPVAKPEPPRPVALERFVLKGPNDDVVGYVQRTRIGKHDTLSDVARRFDLGYDEIVLANPGVDPWLPGVGRVVVVPTQFVLPDAPHTGVVVNVAAMRIFYYPPHKPHQPQIVYTHPIGIGRVAWQTPEGTTRIIGKQKHPVWIVPKSILAEHAKDGQPLPPIVPAGPNNPLGNYLFLLGWPGYLIHGTDKPYGVGMRVSHGCMHLYPEDIKAFFKMIPVGTKVTVVNQPDVFGWRNGTIYMQSFHVLKDDKRDWAKDRRQLLVRLLRPSLRGARSRRRRPKLVGRIDWRRIIALSRSPRGVPVAITDGTPGVDTIIARAPLVADTVPKGSKWSGVNELSISTQSYDALTGKRIKPQPDTVAPASAP